MLLPIGVKFRGSYRGCTKCGSQQSFPLGMTTPNLHCDSFEPSVNFKASLTVLNGKDSFIGYAMSPNNPKWHNAISRKLPNQNLSANSFDSDKNSIINTDGFDRLRLKCMVYPVPENDMVTTRSVHVMQVANVARTICKKLGLNDDLAETIALGHDIGHSPFGHNGEFALNKICKKNGLPSFWHEKNGLRMVDKLLTNVDTNGASQNLNLTYAVRDGIICHCGEVDENYIKPRNSFVPLSSITKPAQYQPYTWEGVVVKIADKVAYLGRDVEDALRLGFYSSVNLNELKNIVRVVKPDFNSEVNNSSLTNFFIGDIVRNSSPQKGIGLSSEGLYVMNSIKKYNMEHIYSKDEVRTISLSQTENILDTIFAYYDGLYCGGKTFSLLTEKDNKYCDSFSKWLLKRCIDVRRDFDNQNVPVYSINNRTDYRQAVVDYISGMTDTFAMKTYNYIQTQKNL